MPIFHKLRLVSLIIILACLSAKAIVINQQLRDSLVTELAKAPTKADSLRLALDVFDASSAEMGQPYGELSYALARQLNRNDIMYDLLGQLSVTYKDNADMLHVMEHRINTMPDIAGKQELQTYIKLRIVENESRRFSPDKLNQLIQKLMTENSDVEYNLYEKIERLFSMCMYLRSLYSDSDLLREYFTQLEELIKKLPENNWFLPMFFYDQMAWCYSTQFDPTIALRADRKLIPLLKSRSDYYVKQNRKYRNLDFSIFNTYRRMLANHIMLTPAEIDSIYGAVIDLTHQNDLVSDEVGICHRTNIYYLMACERYEEALKLMEKSIDLPQNQRYAYILYRYMITAAQNTGDQEAELIASRKYIDLMQDYINQNTERSIQELSIAYKINDYRTSINAMAKQNAKQLQDSSRNLIVGSFIVGAVILIAAVLLFILWRRARRSSVDMARLNEQLKIERDNMERAQDSLIKARDQAKTADRQKSEFINLIGHQVKAPLEAIAEYSQLIVDCMDQTKRQYLERFANVVALNTELIISMVNDISEISSLESDHINLNMRPTDINLVCHMAADSLKHGLPENMELVVTDGPASSVTTDGQRIEQILTNLIENAIKFAERGKIEIATSLDKANRHLIITVSDHGPGIPDDKREAIFDRFVKLDPQSTGMGIGLYASRLLAQLIGATLTVDPEYKHGARFVLTIPY